MKREKELGAGAANAYRHARVESSILEELSAILRDDISDPNLEGVRLTAIVLSPDSKVARVHFAVPRSRSRPAVERAFVRATGFMRGRLAEGVELKRTPDLRFVFEAELDPSGLDAVNDDVNVEVQDKDQDQDEDKDKEEERGG